MTAGQIVLIAVVVVVLLAIGGAIAQRRRLEATGDRFADHLGSANVDLAAAHAEDRGWDPQALEQAARRALEEQRPQARITALTLVQVIDAVGTDEDRAVFRASRDDGGDLVVTLGRRDGAWYAERVEG